MAPRDSQKCRNSPPELLSINARVSNSFDNGHFEGDPIGHYKMDGNGHSTPENCENLVPKVKGQAEFVETRSSRSKLAEKSNSYPKGVYFCMLNELFERFTYYAILVILTFYLRSRYDLTDSAAKLLFHGFVCLCFLTPIIGSVWSDGFTGPYRVVIYLSITYCLGMAMLTVGSVTLAEKNGMVDQILKILGVIGLLLISLASGGRKPCVPAFAADQFPENMQKQRQQFFSYFYMAMNVGTLLTQSAMPTLRGGIACMGEDTCYPMALGVATASIVIAAVIFIIGSSWYKKEHSRDNMIGRVCKCILHALAEIFKRTFKRGEKVQIEKQAPHSHWLDHSVKKFGRPMVDDVRRVLDICVLFIPAITFWALYDQMFSTWLIQTDAMNGRTGENLTILPDQLAMLFSIMILLTIPFLDKVLYPICSKFGFLTTPLQKLGLGGFLAAASFLLAGGLQVKVNQSIYESIQLGYTRHVIYNAHSDARCSLDNFRPIANENDDVIFSQTPNFANNLLQISMPHSKTDIDLVKPYLYEYLNCTGYFDSNNNPGQDLNILEQHKHKRKHNLDRFIVFWHWSEFKQQSPVFDVLYFPKTKPVNGYSRIYPLIDPRLVMDKHNFSLILIFSQNGDVIKEYRMTNNGQHQKFVDIKLPVIGSNVFQLYLKINYYEYSEEKNFISEYTADSGSVDVIVISTNQIQKPATNSNSTNQSLADIPTSTDQNLTVTNGTSVSTNQSLASTLNSINQNFDGFSNSTNQNSTAVVINLIPANQIHLLWQIPQYFLMAAGEATFGIAGMEFAYSQASASMKSVMQAVWLLTCMVGNLLAMFISGLNLIENPATEFFVYAVLMLLFMVSFISTSRKYKYVDQQKSEESQQTSATLKAEVQQVSAVDEDIQRRWNTDYYVSDFQYKTRL